MTDTMTIVPDSQHVPDSELRGLIALLPPSWRPYAMLARFDRPIGWWLLFWPCAWGLFLAGARMPWAMALWMLAGAIAMRGAGCVYNDIVDVDIDRRVARTAARPIASGAVTRRAAWVWIAALLAAGLLVLLQLRWQAQLVALASLLLVAAYPFMKRITGWPQAWLGLVFTWGAPVGWVQASAFDRLAPLGLLYLGCWAWCMGYDTIYACQDREDDMAIGIGSSALSFGRHVRGGVMALYALAIGAWGGAVWLVRPDPLALLALLPVAVHLGWQALTLRPDDGDGALARFRSNRFAGLLMAAACYVVGMS
ncbi:4-hydroxybenzoate octaprenyltransferase [Novosphingobium sp.]|uniref:4-hydroxybenzoate octaprenyltransferase n=1 Tax=Novosphingobium sp. TaxID=1874826 RepID=UPI003D12BB74